MTTEGVRISLYFFSLVKKCVASPLSAGGLSWLSHYLSKHQLGLCPVLSSTEMELEITESTQCYQLAYKRELWQHSWVANQLLKTVNYEEGLCRVIEAREVVSPAVFGKIMAALVCKGMDSYMYIVVPGK